MACIVLIKVINGFFNIHCEIIAYRIANTFIVAVFRIVVPPMQCTLESGRGCNNLTK